MAAGLARPRDLSCPGCGCPWKSASVRSGSLPWCCCGWRRRSGYKQHDMDESTTRLGRNGTVLAWAWMKERLGVSERWRERSTAAAAPGPGGGEDEQKRV